MEKFYNDGWDTAPVAPAHGAMKKAIKDQPDMGEKIGKLQEEMSVIHYKSKKLETKAKLQRNRRNE